MKTDKIYHSLYNPDLGKVLLLAKEEEVLASIKLRGTKLTFNQARRSALVANNAIRKMMQC